MARGASKERLRALRKKFKLGEFARSASKRVKTARKKGKSSSESRSYTPVSSSVSFEMGI